MKNRITTLFASFLILITACNDSNITDMGSNIQPPGDKILVDQKRFDIRSENYFVNFMYSRPDSFLLGTFYDKNYGTVHADIFAQVEHPKNHIYPPNTTPDSILLVMYYRKYFGDKHAPMHVSVYEMNKATFNFSTPYPTNLNPDHYVDRTNQSLLIGEKTFTAVDAKGKADSTYVVIKLSNEFMQRFTNIDPVIYTKDSLFLDFFKGLYITTDFGSASMLYIRQIDMEYHHSYTYTTKKISGQDSIVKVNVSVSFPANSWVRQVNRFLHPDKNSIISQLESQPEQIHHISSPANIYTRISLPIKKMQEDMESDVSKRLTINNAKLRVDINNLNEENFPQPIPSNVMLIRESSLNRFFAKRELPSDTCAILGSYAYEKNSDTGQTDYYYSFDIAGLIAHEFKQAKINNTTPPEKTDFLLVPVRIKTNSGGSVTAVSQQFLLNAVTICGGNHPKKPIKANVVFSLF
ncbi:MAG: DUF4270 domain-containing protein [Paludibacter sp.]|nr:DUF4270 domain-containing protein [Paludibacter sp.]MDD4198655.1 DUF4270 domain-containing protein [Paludibacter sp.]MDD4428355.1 DUF4270 domain-containing protein [Paludibacter sp.]